MGPDQGSELTGCDPKTVSHYIDIRDAGGDPFARVRRPRLVDPHLEKIEELVERSHGKIRADVVHARLVAMSFAGDERTTRRAVAEAKKAYAAGHRRTYRPWVPEPGMWAQYDWGQGPVVCGRPTCLFCAWLAWSRFRVVIPTWDRTLETTLACIDGTLRRFGAVPTYLLTDNERAVTVDRVAGLAVRHPAMVAAGRHYGMVIETAVPHDPETKGGVEATVKIAKADLVLTDANLRVDYASFAELASARKLTVRSDFTVWARDQYGNRAEKAVPAGQNIPCVCCDGTGLDLEHVIWACAAPYGACQPDRQAAAIVCVAGRFVSPQTAPIVRVYLNEKQCGVPGGHSRLPGASSTLGPHQAITGRTSADGRVTPWLAPP